jgi:hypothetical protein
LLTVFFTFANDKKVAVIIFAKVRNVEMCPQAAKTEPATDYNTNKYIPWGMLDVFFQKTILFCFCSTAHTVGKWSYAGLHFEQ